MLRGCCASGHVRRTNAMHRRSRPSNGPPRAQLQSCRRSRGNQPIHFVGFPGARRRTRILSNVSSTVRYPGTEDPRVRQHAGGSTFLDVEMPDGQRFRIPSDWTTVAGCAPPVASTRGSLAHFSPCLNRSGHWRIGLGSQGHDREPALLALLAWEERLVRWQRSRSGPRQTTRHCSAAGQLDIFARGSEYRHFIFNSR